MESSDASQSVRVAVNIRPLEHLVGCSDCISVTPGEPQVQIGSHSFTFDHVYGSTASPSTRIFEDCVEPLVDALFRGYNATVLAYGQTGSGKTYTMGTNYNGRCTNGIIPKVMHTIFKRVEEAKGTTEFLIRVSFIEIFKEEVFDLLESNPTVYPKADRNVKPVGPSRAPIQIRETANGRISLVGVTEAEVTSQDEMASYLLHGSVCRAKGSTNMNSQSSRSHAIFTITMEQKRLSGTANGVAYDDAADDILCAKLHLVDLAGSERAKKTGADETRLREGILINKGLLALGNVISALGDDKKRREGAHVTYRDSKLTRLLQDSLGGNNKTVMIACVSPASINAEETLNTLTYANRARNIQNKAVVNRDAMTAQVKNQIEQLQAELLSVKCTLSEDVQILKQKIALLEAGNADLQNQLQECQVTIEHLTKQAIDAQVNRDAVTAHMNNQIEQLQAELLSVKSTLFEDVQILKQKIALLEAGNADLQSQLQDCQVTIEHLTEQAIDAQNVDVLKTYVSKVQELEEELNTSKHSEHMDLDDNVLHPKSGLFPESDLKAAEVAGDVEEEIEHCSLQEKLDNEVKELDKRLEQKEQEIERLRRNLENILSVPDQKLKESYLQKFDLLESQVANLKSKKEVAQAQLLQHKERSDEASKRLQVQLRLKAACACKYRSTCKTNRCGCRKLEVSCSMACGCQPKNCTNRVAVVVEPDSKTEGTIVDMLYDGEELDKRSSELASHGATLVETKDTNDDKGKPLSDVGNKIVSETGTTSGGLVQRWWWTWKRRG